MTEKSILDSNQALKPGRLGVFTEYLGSMTPQLILIDIDYSYHISPE
jgi:hypothetical protein